MLDRSSHSNTLGLPDNVAFDMFFNDGIHVASAGFILSKLRKGRNIHWFVTLILMTTIKPRPNMPQRVRMKKRASVHQ